MRPRWYFVLWSDPHNAHTSGSRKMPYPGRPRKIQERRQRLQSNYQISISIFHAFQQLFPNSNQFFFKFTLQVTLAEGGTRGLGRGWAPTFFGYSAQGMFKFGLYEVFKVRYAELIGEELSYEYRTGLYLAASASAEFFADIGLAPMEAAKVRIQTMPGYANTLREAFPKMYADEGLGGFYKGLVPLWFRQIPYTMMKFACFERTLELLYKYVVPKPRLECTKGEQLIVTFAAGYIAGVFCAVVSHPADSVSVSFFFIKYKQE